jgi:hypothetical protein
VAVTLQPKQEQALAAVIEREACRSVDEFIDAASAMLPGEPAKTSRTAPRYSRPWELRQELRLP